MVDMAPAPTVRAKRRPAGALRDPEWTKAQLLSAAREEFAEHGLSGARVNDIAARAGVNKQLLYYYFRDKERLYTEVLHRAYVEIRNGEQHLDLDNLPPREAMERFIRFNFDYFVEHRYFVALLNDENVHRARHVKQAPHLRDLHKRLRHTIGRALKRGLADGSFKRKVDPIDLYISIASLCYFYHSNNFTMSAIFDRDLSQPSQIRRRRRHIVDMVMNFLTN